MSSVWNRLLPLVIALAVAVGCRPQQELTPPSGGGAVRLEQTGTLLGRDATDSLVIEILGQPRTYMLSPEAQVQAQDLQDGDPVRFTWYEWEVPTAGRDAGERQQVIERIERDTAPPPA
jgi:hypothetical protein